MVKSLNLMYQGNYQKAEKLTRKALSIQRQSLGELHPATLLNLVSLSGILSRQEKYDEAATVARDSFEGQRIVFGESHPNTLIAKCNLAECYGNQDKFSEAEDLYKQCLDHRN